MQTRVLTTPVDSLVDIVKQHKHIRIEELTKHLKLPSSIIEKWLVVLEEYQVLKVNYSGFEGYVEYSEKQKSNEIDVEDIKTEFIEKCKNKGLTFDQIKPIWHQFLDKAKPQIKEEFFKKSKSQGYKYSKIQIAWKKFEKELEDV